MASLKLKRFKLRLTKYKYLKTLLRNLFLRAQSLITLVEMRRSSFISIDTGNGDDQSDEESTPDFPVQLRKPPKRHKSPADRLHLAVWNSDCDAVRDLVHQKGSSSTAFLFFAFLLSLAQHWSYCFESWARLLGVSATSTKIEFGIESRSIFYL